MALVFLCFALFPLSGETVLRDPVIPHGETAVYSAREDEKEFTYVERVSVTEENGRSVYGFVYETNQETVEVKMDKSTMVPFSVHSINAGNGVSIESSTQVSFGNQLRSDGIQVLSFTDLKYILRGYPFGKISEDLAIKFISTTDNEDDSANFSVKISFDDTEELEIGNRIIECYRVELKMSGSGMMRVLKPFIPKTYFWYSTSAPHYLVAYEGSGGFPGSPKRHVQIVDYSGWN